MVPDDYYLSQMRKENSGKGLGCGLEHREALTEAVGLADAVIHLGGGSKVVRSC